MPSNEIPLYAKDKQRSYTEYVTKTGIEPTEATGIISLSLNLICPEYEFETFGSTSDQIRSMTFYLHSDVSLETDVR